MDESPEARWPSWQFRQVQRWRSGHGEWLDDAIAEEVPVVLVYNGEPHVVMLATPLDLEDFALGFSLTEGIIESVSELHAVRVYPRAKGIEVRLTIPEARCERTVDQGRNLTGRTGCGLCGARTLEAAIRTPPKVSDVLSLDQTALTDALTILPAFQRINQRTGAVHAAAWFSPERLQFPTVREDVGRHNALDKLIGALSAKRTNMAEGFVVVTSRASYEMVQKCAMAGVGLLAAMSAPTGLAIRLAESVGVTLVGFLREQGHVVYTHPQRLNQKKLFEEEGQHPLTSVSER